MKPIGPYVAVQPLPSPVGGVAAADSPIQTLRATDRLTGIPVLLHLLPHAQGLPEVPPSPWLLPVVDSGVDGEYTYLVTELPLQAHPAQDPLLAARGALQALSALHAHGLAHGGVSATQLWNHGGGVALAGAGLPWGGDATPQGDLADLVLTLQALGAVPEALLPLRERPGSLTAAQALARIDASAPPPEPVALVPERVALEPPAGTAEKVGAAGKAEATGTAERVREEVTGAEEASAPRPPGPQPARGASGATPVGGSVPAGGGVPPTGQGETPAPVVLTAAPAHARTPATSAFSNAPAGQSETPQERRKRQNDERREQAMADSRAAAARKAARLKAQKEEEAREAAKAAEQAALGVPVPEPFQMGFAGGTAGFEAGTGAGEEGAGEGVRPGPQPRQVERLPASLRRGDGAQAGDAVQRLPGGVSAGRPPSARNLAPIKIGWDEDDSWRVVRTAPRGRPSFSLLRWVPLVLVVIVVLGAALLWALRPAHPAPAARTDTPVAAAVTGVPDVISVPVRLVPSRVPGPRPFV